MLLRDWRAEEWKAHAERYHKTRGSSHCEAPISYLGKSQVIRDYLTIVSTLAISVGLSGYEAVYPGKSLKQKQNVQRLIP
jgi:hypothetical protein